MPAAIGDCVRQTRSKPPGDVTGKQRGIHRTTPRDRLFSERLDNIQPSVRRVCLSVQICLPGKRHPEHRTGNARTGAATPAQRMISSSSFLGSPTPAEVEVSHRCRRAMVLPTSPRQLTQGGQPANFSHVTSPPRPASTLTTSA